MFGKSEWFRPSSHRIPRPSGRAGFLLLCRLDRGDITSYRSVALPRPGPRIFGLASGIERVRRLGSSKTQTNPGRKKSLRQPFLHFLRRANGRGN